MLRRAPRIDRLTCLDQVPQPVAEPLHLVVTTPQLRIIVEALDRLGPRVDDRDYLLAWCRVRLRVAERNERAAS